MKEFAICISGHMRNYEQCFPYLKKNILDKLDCDVFIHTWEDSITKWNNVIEIYKPINICIERQKQFPEKYTNKNKRSDGTFSNIGTISMHYKINACNNIKINNENYFNKKYKCVIRLRPDVIIINEISENDLNDLNNIYVLSIGDRSIWIDDTFAFSSSENMDRYSSTYNYLDELYEVNNQLHPETILRLSLEKFKIQYAVTKINGGILRNDGSVESHHFSGHIADLII